jgi:hypothetical protein
MEGLGGAINGYIIEEELGTGAFGTVYQVGG